MAGWPAVVGSFSTGAEIRAGRSSFAPLLLGDPLRIIKPPGSHRPENAAANVRQIGDAARLHMGYGSSIEKLNQKPYTIKSAAEMKVARSKTEMTRRERIRSRG